MSDSEDDDSVSNIDFSVISNSIEVGGHMINQIINGIHYGSAEVQNLLRNECDVILECKICRNLFRSFPNFVAHKRVYCLAKNVNRLHGVPVEKLKDLEENIVVQPTSPETPSGENQQPSQTTVIEQLKNGSFEGQSEAYKLYTKAAEKIESQKMQRTVTTVTLTPIATNQNAVSITVTESESDIANSEVANTSQSENGNLEVTEPRQPEKSNSDRPSTSSSILRNILERPQPQKELTNEKGAQEAPAETISPEVVKSKEKVEAKKTLLAKELLRPVKSNLGNADRSVLTELSKKGQCDIKKMKCLMCGKKMASKKSLWNHMQFSHAKKQVQYPCLFCDKVYRYFFGLTRHIMHQHKKTPKQVADIRGKLRSMAYEKGEETSNESVDTTESHTDLTPPEKVVLKRPEPPQRKSTALSLYNCEGCYKAFWKKGTYNDHTKRCKWLLLSRAVPRLEGKGQGASNKDTKKNERIQEENGMQSENKQTFRQNDSVAEKIEQKSQPSPKKDEAEGKRGETNQATPKTSPKKDEEKKTAQESPVRFINTRCSSAKLLEAKYMRTRFIEKRRAIQMQAGRRRDDSLSESPKDKGSKMSPNKSQGDSSSDRSPSKDRMSSKTSPIKSKDAISKSAGTEEEDLKEGYVRDTKADKNLAQTFEKIETRSSVKDGGSVKTSDGTEMDKSLRQLRGQTTDVREPEKKTERMSRSQNRVTPSEVGGAAVVHTSRLRQSSEDRSDKVSTRERSSDRVQTRHSATTSRESSAERKMTRSSSDVGSIEGTGEQKPVFLSHKRWATVHPRTSPSDPEVIASKNAAQAVSKLTSPCSSKSQNKPGQQNLDVLAADTDGHVTRSKGTSGNTTELVTRSTRNMVVAENADGDNMEKNSGTINSEEMDPHSTKDTSSKLLVKSGKSRKILTDNLQKHIFAIQGKISVEGDSDNSYDDDDDDNGDDDNDNDLEPNFPHSEENNVTQTENNKEAGQVEHLRRSRRKQEMVARQTDEIDGTLTKRQVIEKSPDEEASTQVSSVRTRRSAVAGDSVVKRLESNVNKRTSTGSTSGEAPTGAQGNTPDKETESSFYMTTRNRGKRSVDGGTSSPSKHNVDAERKNKQNSPGTSNSTVNSQTHASTLAKSPPSNIVSIQEIWVDKQPGCPTEEVKSNKIFVRPLNVQVTPVSERPKHTNRMYVVAPERSAKAKCLDMNYVTYLMDINESKCRQCDMHFSSVSNLRRHVVRHLGWKRYKCRLCKFTSYNRSECNSHLVRSHAEKLIGCSVSSFIIDLNKEATKVRTMKKQQTIQNKQLTESKEMESKASVQRPKRQVSLQRKTLMTTRGSLSSSAKSASEGQGAVGKRGAQQKTNAAEDDTVLHITRSSTRRTETDHSEGEDDSRSSASWRSSQSEKRQERKRKRDLDETDSSYDQTPPQKTQKFNAKKKCTEESEQKGDYLHLQGRQRSASLDGSYSRQSMESSCSNDSEDLYDNLTSVSDVENNYGGSMGSPTRSEDAGFTSVRLNPNVQTMIAALEEARASVKKRKGGGKRCTSPGKRVSSSGSVDSAPGASVRPSKSPRLSLDSRISQRKKDDQQSNTRSNDSSLEMKTRSKDDSSAERKTRSSDNISSEMKTKAGSESSTERKTRSSNESILERKTRSSEDDSTERKTRSSSESNFERKTRSNEACSTERNTRSSGDDSTEGKSRSSEDGSTERKTRSSEDSSTERKTMSSENGSTERKSRLGNEISLERKTRSSEDGSTERKTRSSENGSTERKTRSSNESNFERKTRSNEACSTERKTRSSEDGSTERKSRSSEDGSTERKTRSSEDSSAEGKTRSSEDGSTERKTRSSNESSLERKTRSSEDGSTERKTRSSEDGSTERKTRSSEDSSTERKIRSSEDGSTERKTRSSEDGSTERKTRSNENSSTEGKTRSSNESSLERKTSSSEDSSTERKSRSSEDGSTERKTRSINENSSEPSTMASGESSAERKTRSSNENMREISTDKIFRSDEKTSTQRPGNSDSTEEVKSDKNKVNSDTDRPTADDPRVTSEKCVDEESELEDAKKGDNSCADSSNVENCASVSDSSEKDKAGNGETKQVDSSGES